MIESNQVACEPRILKPRESLPEELALKQLPGKEPRYLTSIRNVYDYRNTVKVTAYIPAQDLLLEASFGLGPEISVGAAVEVGKTLRRLLMDQVAELGLKDVIEQPADVTPVEHVHVGQRLEVQPTPEAETPPAVAPEAATPPPEAPAPKRRGRPPGKAKEAAPPPVAETPAAPDPEPAPESTPEPEPQVPIPATAADPDVMTIDKALNFVVVYGAKAGKKMSDVGDNLIRWYATVMLPRIQTDEKRVPTADETRQALAAKTILEERARK